MDLIIIPPSNKDLKSKERTFRFVIREEVLLKMALSN